VNCIGESRRAAFFHITHRTPPDSDRGAEKGDIPWGNIL
jgi:hypothetical protein